MQTSLVFILDSKKIFAADQVVVRLGEKTVDGRVLPESPARLYQEWDKLAQGEAEKKALKRLSAGQMRALFQEAVLPLPEILLFFRDLANSRALYCAGR